MIADRIRAGLEARTTLKDPADWLLDAFGAGKTIAGKRVNAQTVMGLPAVNACVTAMAEAGLMVPAIVYREDADGVKQRARETVQWDILHNFPNPEMSAGEFFQFWITCRLLTGNFFAYIERMENGEPLAAWPLKPSNVSVGRNKQGIYYRIITDDGRQAVGTAADILHDRRMTRDGLLGTSPITDAREALGVALAQQSVRAASFENGSRPSGVIQVPGLVDPEAAERLRAGWERLHRGLENIGKVAVLEQGATWQQISMSGSDQQFVEQMNFDVQEAARMMRVPPSWINAPSGSSMTYSTVEQESIAGITYGLSPHLESAKGAIKRSPLWTDSSLDLDFLYDALLRTDTKTRYEAHGIAIDKGFLTINEVRRLENRPPVTWGDTRQEAKAAHESAVGK